MNFLELARSRYSVRKYASQNVEREKLDYIMECARLAPSACNRQPWTIYVVEDSAAKEKIAEAYPREWLLSAPVFLVLTAHHDQSWHRTHDNKDHADVDMAILAEHIALAAAEQGLGTCWICAFDPKKLAAAMALADGDEEPVVLMPLGYPAAEIKPQEKIRKLQSEIVVRR